MAWLCVNTVERHTNDAPRGRKPILLSALGIFAISSIICATASSMTMLIAGRALQGVGGSGLIMMVEICVADLFSVR